MMPVRIHRDKMFVSGEAWRLFQEAHPEHDFFDFWLEVSLGFLWDASIFLPSSTFVRRRVPVLRIQVSR
jgi:hypothetical protein